MKKLLNGIVAVCLSVCTCFAFSACGNKNSNNAEPTEQTSYSIITKLDLSVDFDGDTAIAKVKNTFTLFPATATVYVYLYYSETETYSYTCMQEVATGYVYDLDQGETLSASWDTEGRGGYFTARMRYKIDSREWEERCTEVYERDYTKVILEPIEDDGSLPVFEDIEPAVPYLTYENDYNGFEDLYGDVLFTLDFPEKIISKQLALENGALKNFTDSIEKEFYVFIPISEDCFTSFSNHIIYSVYKKDREFILNKYIKIYAPKLGFADQSDFELITGFGFWNLNFNLMFSNIDSTNINGKLQLRFGKREKLNIMEEDKFINLYLGDSCIGTCYYTTNTAEDLTYAFFYNLFAEGLRII